MFVSAAAESAPALHRRWLATALPKLRGRVLDVGAGTGLTARYLDESVRWEALEPSARARRTLGPVVASREHSVLLTEPVEQLTLQDQSVDAVICSTVLCSVADPARALSEIRRVLRPAGSLVFFEHVAAQDRTAARVVQGLLRPLTHRFGGGCDPTRDTAAVIRAAGWGDLHLEWTRPGGAFGWLAPVIIGTATRG